MTIKAVSMVTDKDVGEMDMLCFVVQTEMWRDMIHCPDDGVPKKWVIEASKQGTPVLLAVIQGARVPGIFEECFVVKTGTFKRCEIYPDGTRFCEACSQNITSWFDREMVKVKEVLGKVH